MTTAPAMPEIADAPVALAADFPPATLDRWRQLIDKALAGAAFERRLVSLSVDGLRIEPLFNSRPKDLGIAHGSRAGRGGWDIRQIYAGTDPATTNASILEDLAGCSTSVALQVAAPGRCGLPSGPTALARALDGVLLDVCPVILRAGENTPDAADALVDVWAKLDIAPSSRLGGFGYDPLGTLAETGALARALPDALAIAGHLVTRTLPWPGVSALLADGHVWHAAGASEAQELAAILATIATYLRAAEAAGIGPAAALPKIAVTVAVDADQLMGLAKVRAVRRHIDRIAEACGAPGAGARVKVCAETSRAMMTRRDPWTNLLRTTMACATAAWAGADAITVLPFSWALGQPDSLARRMARNTSIVLMEESALGRVADPAAGSFAVETLTNELAHTAWRLFQDLEAGGGLETALAEGRWQRAIAATADLKRAAFATGKMALVGTSAFPQLGDDGIATIAWPAPLPVAVDVGGARVVPLPPFRPSEPFEALRDDAEAAAVRTGHLPSVFLVCLGPLADYSARASWIVNFLAAGGIEVIRSEPITQSPDAGRAFAASGAAVACLCGSDSTYGELGVAVTSLLKTAGAKHIAIAGRPKTFETELKAAGVDALIYAGCDMVSVLQTIHAALGIARAAS